MTNYHKSDGTVYGRVTKSKTISYKAYWVVPTGYLDAGSDYFIGEYTTPEIAQQKMQEWIMDKWEQQEEAQTKFARKTSWFLKDK
jgi:hypothetical protein